jgi:ATP-dependent exoDNAse (exonuclease V) beta subunit
MEKDTLKDLLTQIEAYCHKHQIATFYGSPDEHNSPLVLWDREEDEDWQRYLAALQKSPSPILIISDLGELQEEDLEPSVYAALKPEEQKAYSEALQELKEVKGHLTGFTLTFFAAGVAYQYHHEAPWIEHYHTLLSYQEPPDEEQQSGIEEKEAPLGVEQIDQVVRKVLSSPQYLSAPNRLQRRATVAALLQDQGIEEQGTILHIFNRVEALYQQEVQPALEKELKAKIRQFKQQGLKKVEIRTRLGISERALDKHWY